VLEGFLGGVYEGSELRVVIVLRVVEVVLIVRVVLVVMVVVTSRGSGVGRRLLRHLGLHAPRDVRPRVLAQVILTVEPCGVIFW
jgi:hypothetical protein